MQKKKKPRGRVRVAPTGVERPWTEDELIVTKTDIKGRITYANEVFLRLAELDEEEALGAPHNIIRHPDMPKCVFKLLWDTLATKREIFAFVNNLSTTGGHYWVFAHVTPSMDAAGNVTGYHSNRRKPSGAQIAKIVPIYALLLAEERKHSTPVAGMAASTQLLLSLLKQQGMTYDEFVFSI
mgnify:CR=1 FL=1